MCVTQLLVAGDVGVLIIIVSRGDTRGQGKTWTGINSKHVSEGVFANSWGSPCNECQFFIYLFFFCIEFWLLVDGQFLIYKANELWGCLIIKNSSSPRSVW